MPNKIELLRVICVMEGVIKNEKDEPVGELELGTARAYPSQFDQLPDTLRDLFKQAQAEFEAKEHAQEKRKPKARTRPKR